MLKFFTAKRLLVRRQAVLTVALASVCTCACGAAEWFVAPAGDDTNPGTGEKPFATLSHACAAARATRPAADNTIWLRGGELTACSKHWNSPPPILD